MKLEDQVCSLELAKQLKELGVKQEGLYFWFNGGGAWHIVLNKAGVEEPSKSIFSAFTVAELGEMLPKMENIVVMIFDNGRCQLCLQQTPVEGKVTPIFEADTEADARAKMLIYLIENKLITLS